MRKLLALLVFGSCSANAMLVSQPEVEAELVAAPLVADIEIVAKQTLDDPAYLTRTEAQFRILSVHRSALTLPREDILILETPGGERNGVGTLYSGLPRPFVGQRYRAHLRPIAGSSHYEVAGFESGLVSLTPSRVGTRNRTDGSNGEGTGAYLYWDQDYFPIPYFIARESFRGFPEFSSELQKSFLTWGEVEDSRVEFLPLGCSLTNQNQNDGLNNIILITKNWTMDKSSIAITRSFYVGTGSDKEGMILDADVLLNGVNHAFTVSQESGKYDLQNVVTHEIGHFLGLGHEVDPVNSEGTMLATTVPGETKKRTLHDNDLEQLRSIYPGSGSKSNFSGAACEIPDGTAGCLAVHHGQANKSSLLLAVLWLITTLGLGRLNRRFI